MQNTSRKPSVAISTCFGPVLVLGVLMASSGPVGAQEIGFPEGLIYGEWCGVDHPRDPDRAPPPTDEIDAACKKHDAAYGLTEPWGNSDADQELADTLTEILQRGTVWNIGADGRRESRTEMSSRQYRVAATIAAWMAGQSFPTLYSDIVNGKVSSVLKWGVSATEVVIAVPTKIPAADGGSGPVRAEPGPTSPRVRAVSAVDPELGRPGGPGRGSPQRREHDGGA